MGYARPVRWGCRPCEMLSPGDVGAGRGAIRRLNASVGTSLCHWSWCCLATAQSDHGATLSQRELLLGRDTGRGTADAALRGSASRLGCGHCAVSPLADSTTPLATRRDSNTYFRTASTERYQGNRCELRNNCPNSFKRSVTSEASVCRWKLSSATSQYLLSPLVSAM